VIEPAAPVRPLPELLAALRDRGLRRGVEPMEGEPRGTLGRGSLPTGQPELDAALRTGGWPRGALAQLDGPRGSGATSLALGSVAACQERGGIAAWVDAAGSFDPATATRLGVRLEWLLLVRPASVPEAIELAGWLVRSGLVDVTVIDLEDPDVLRPGTRAADPDRLGPGLARLAALLARGRSLGILLPGDRLRRTAAASAGVRVELVRRAWLAVGRDLVGQRVGASVARHRWALAGGEATFDVWFREGRRIDPLLPGLAVPREVPVAGTVVPAAAIGPVVTAAGEHPELRVLSA
jgi:hypothetical protein